jgi:3-hydroxyacyl-CoA dehydrogenase
MALMEIRKLGVIGCGQMGGGIATKEDIDTE